MKPVELRCETTFDAAHRLSFHKGKCKNLHGHTWRVEIQIHKDMSDDEDILVDFGDIKAFINSNFDHRVLCYEQDDLLMQLTQDLGIERTVLQFETTAENLAVCIKRKLEESVPQSVIMVTVYETANNSASAV